MIQPGTALIEALQNPAVYPHAVDALAIIETHISWVILTGPYAYKIKKPVDLGFLNFSTLDKRRFYCQEELRLNRRLAPELYLEVVAITGSPDRPELNGTQPAIEYAVKMVQFPQEAQLDRVLDRGELTPTLIDRIAGLIARFHRQARRASVDSLFGSPERIRQPVMENFVQIRDHISNTDDLAILSQLEAWTEKAYLAQRERFEQRKRAGYIRECHGDMHLRNMALVRGDVVIFDCIEFNENLHWIDVMSEVAFLDMDLEDRGQPALAHRFLNAYLQTTGDYGGLAVLRFYQVYRAMVRAKVATILLGQSGLGPKEREQTTSEFRSYLMLANRYVHGSAPLLIITHGLSGSGKTTYSQPLLETLGAIRIRSDIERKRLFGLSPEARSAADVDSGIYTREAGIQTYDRLAQLAEKMLDEGYRVIVDATFLQRTQRDQFRQLAQRLRVPFAILAFRAGADQLRERVAHRQQTGLDASDAGLAVLEHQLKSYEPVAPDEQPFTLQVNSDEPVKIAQLTLELEGRTRAP